MSQLFGQSPYTSGKTPSGPAARPGSSSLPPPPPSMEAEIEIRTMRSDLEQMGGQANAMGNLTFSVSQPQPQVRIQMAPVASREDNSDITPNRNYMSLLWIFIGLIFAGLLFAAGYFLLPKLLPANQQPAVNSTSTTATSSGSSLTASSTRVFLGYVPFTKLPSDGKFNIVFTEEVTRQSLVESIMDSVGQGNATSAPSHFAEVILKNKDGQPMPWISYLGLVQANLLPENLWQQYFEQSFNLFLLRDEKGAWPVYILKLKDDQSKLLTENKIGIMAQSKSDFPKLYFYPPGPEATGLEDADVYEEKVRALTYASPGARFVYGWIGKKYFVIGTSVQAFEEAGRRL